MKAVFIMTKLVKKSVDVEKVLSKPRQSWLERLMVWGLSKLAIATVFVVIIGWLGKANATFSVQKIPEDPFPNIRNIILLIGLFTMLSCAVLASFKKFSYFISWGIFSCMMSLFAAGMAIDYITTENSFFFSFLLTFSIGIILFFLPIFVSLIQYIRKRINRSLLKRRLLIWASAFFVSWGILIAIAFILSSVYENTLS